MFLGISNSFFESLDRKWREVEGHASVAEMLLEWESIINSSLKHEVCEKMLVCVRTVTQ